MSRLFVALLIAAVVCAVCALAAPRTMRASDILRPKKWYNFNDNVDVQKKWYDWQTVKSKREGPTASFDYNTEWNYNRL